MAEQSEDAKYSGAERSEAISNGMFYHLAIARGTINHDIQFPWWKLAFPMMKSKPGAIAQKYSYMKESLPNFVGEIRDFWHAVSTKYRFEEVPAAFYMTWADAWPLAMPSRHSSWRKSFDAQVKELKLFLQADIEFPEFTPFAVLIEKEIDFLSKLEKVVELID